MTITTDTTLLHDPRRQAALLYWQGFSVPQIAAMLQMKRPTVQSWKQRDGWDSVAPISRVEMSLEARLTQLIIKPQKTGGDFKEIDLLGRQIERLARVNRYSQTGNEADLNPNIAKRRIVFPFFQRVDHAALQLLEREHRRLVVNKFTHEQVFKIVGAVFAFELLNVEQRAATFQGVLNGDNLPPLAVRTEKTSSKGVMTDVDFHAFGGAGASPVEQFTRPERVGVVRQCGRGGEIGRAQVTL